MKNKNEPYQGLSHPLPPSGSKEESLAQWEKNARKQNYKGENLAKEIYVSMVKVKNQQKEEL